jgi:hypothetical protein
MSARPIRVLLVEDNPGDARLVELALAESPGEPFEVSTADRLADALEGDRGKCLAAGWTTT